MKHLNLLLTAAIAVTLSACIGKGREHRDHAATAATDTTTDTTARAQMYTSDVNLNGDEKLFILGVTKNALLEVEAATYYSGKAKNEALKKFAKELIPLYTKAGTDVGLIAKGKGVAPPTVLSEENIQKLTILKTLEGRELDHAYVKLLLDEQATAEALLGKAATFKNQDLQKFALNLLSEIQTQRKEANQFAKKLNLPNTNNGQDLQ